LKYPACCHVGEQQAFAGCSRAGGAASLAEDEVHPPTTSSIQLPLLLLYPEPSAGSGLALTSCGSYALDRDSGPTCGQSSSHDPVYAPEQIRYCPVLHVVISKYPNQYWIAWCIEHGMNNTAFDASYRIIYLIF
jgi:hypothetical protein